VVERRNILFPAKPITGKKVSSPMFPNVVGLTELEKLLVAEERVLLLLLQVCNTVLTVFQEARMGIFQVLEEVSAQLVRIEVCDVDRRKVDCGPRRLIVLVWFTAIRLQWGHRVRAAAFLIHCADWVQ